jgi:hypothetical protein
LKSQSTKAQRSCASARRFSGKDCPQSRVRSPQSENLIDCGLRTLDCGLKNYAFKHLSSNQFNRSALAIGATKESVETTNTTPAKNFFILYFLLYFFNEAKKFGFTRNLFMPERKAHKARGGDKKLSNSIPK